MDFPGGSLLRIEPVRRKPEQSQIECLAENGAGDPVYSKATLVVYDGKKMIIICITYSIRCHRAWWRLMEKPFVYV